MRTDESSDPPPPEAPLRPASTDGAPDPNATGSPEGVPGEHSGITGRETKERQAALRRGKVRAHETAEGNAPPRDPYSGIARSGVAHHAFAALAENVRDYAIFLMDPGGIITFWGEGARLIKWWTKDQAEGAHLRLLYPDGGAEDGTAEEHLQSAARSGEYTGEGHRTRSDGSTFWGGITLTALRDSQGSLLGFAKVTRDLTAQRAAEAARKAAFEAAEEASRLKSLFLATMSHEMRTPLNAVMAYTDLLGMELAGPLTPAHHEQLGKIRSSSQHLLGIIDDVLDLSRMQSGKVTTARTRLRVGVVVSEALTLVEPQAAARGVHLADAVSGFATHLLYWGDGDRVRQILLNLLGNAVKFTGSGGRITLSAGTASEPPATAELEGSGPWVYFRVEDTGQGIPPDRLEAIFEPFVQADMALTRQHGGTGLGLSISRHLARLMGGDLTARSELGVGSTLFLWLPAAPEEEAKAASSQANAGSDHILSDIRDAILTEMERVLHAYVARLQSDPATPGARAVPEAELEDHLASFLSDVAETFGAAGLTSGAESEVLRDGTSIQRTIAERHGGQRARLGWSEDEVRREFQILREELSAAVRRRVHRPRSAEVEEALGVVEEAIARAERTSLEAYRAGG